MSTTPSTTEAIVKVSEEIATSNSVFAGGLAAVAALAICAFLIFWLWPKRPSVLRQTVALVAVVPALALGVFTGIAVGNAVGHADPLINYQATGHVLSWRP